MEETKVLNDQIAVFSGWDTIAAVKDLLGIPEDKEVSLFKYSPLDGEETRIERDIEFEIEEDLALKIAEDLGIDSPERGKYHSISFGNPPFKCAVSFARPNPIDKKPTLGRVHIGLLKPWEGTNEELYHIINEKFGLEGLEGIFPDQKETVILGDSTAIFYGRDKVDVIKRMLGIPTNVYITTFKYAKPNIKKGLSFGLKVDSFKNSTVNDERTEVEFDVDEELSRILEATFGIFKEGSYYRAIYYGDSLVLGHTTFSKRNTKNDKSYLGRVHIKFEEPLAEKNKDMILRMINSTFQIEKRKSIYRHLCTTLEYPPGVDEFADPFDPDNANDLQINLCTSGDDKLPDLASLKPLTQSTPGGVVPIELRLLDSLVFIESFAENKIKQERNIEVYMCAIPVRVPIAFQNNNGNVRVFSFDNFNGIELSKTSEMFCSILNKHILANDRKYYVEFNYMMKPEQIAIAHIAKDLNITVFMMDLIELQEKEQGHSLYNFKLILVTKESTNAARGEEIKKFNIMKNKIFARYGVYTCNLCGNSSASGETCPENYHAGQLEQFEDSTGKTVYIEKEEEPGLEINNYYVKYTCCGKTEHLSSCKQSQSNLTTHTVPFDFNQIKSYTSVIKAV